MRCLVTGGAGFIGTHIVRKLLANGEHVVVLDNLSGGFQENIPSGAVFVKGDICDHDLVDQLFAEHRFENVYHLAAYAAEGLSHFIKRYNYNNNLIGSVNLISAAVNYQVKTFIFTSSIAVYGAGQLPLREDMIPQPEDSYGVAKLAVEQELKCSREMFGLDYVIFRPHNVFGEYQNIGDRYRNVIGIFMNQIMQNKPLTIFGDGTQTRAFSYVGPVAEIIARAPYEAAALNQVFNVGADQPWSVNDLSRLVAKAMDAQVDIEYLPARNEVLHAWSDHSRVKQIFSGVSDVPLDEGLRLMAAWAKQHGARKTAAFTEIEIEKNLPQSWRNELKSLPALPSLPSIPTMQPN